jgi:hypothetical protein
LGELSRTTPASAISASNEQLPRPVGGPDAEPLKLLNGVFGALPIVVGDLSREISLVSA